MKDPGQCSLRFFGRLAFGDFAVVEAAAGGVVAELGDGDGVDRPVRVAVAARVEPMPRFGAPTMPRSARWRCRSRSDHTRGTGRCRWSGR
jgi:hypothetical protein